MNTTAPHTSASARDDLYVNYLPLPARDRRFLSIIIPAALGFLLGFGIIWARSQPSPGPAVWQTSTPDGQPRSFRGRIVIQPYPILFTDDDGTGKPGAILLIESGKHGALARATPFDGQQTIAVGWVLQREGQVMLELDPRPSALTADTDTARATKLPTRKPLITSTFRGEIVDAKCFLGSMKPGDGKTHKECATLCIRAGIPAMFISRDPAGKPAWFLLANHDAAPINPALHPFIADAVELSGQIEEWGTLRILRVKAQDVHRL